MLLLFRRNLSLNGEPNVWNRTSISSTHAYRRRAFIEDVAAYLNFVVKNYIGATPDNELNLAIAAKIFALAESARQRRLQFA